MKEEMQCEMKDIIEMIRRFVIANKHEVAFVGSFIAFDNNGEVKDEANLMLGYGEKDVLRLTLNDLRDMIEDDVDKDGFVNV